MHPGRIEGATRVVLAIPKIAIKDVTLSNGDNAMGSVWFPTPEELKALVAGAPVSLWIAAANMPAVVVAVGRPPE